MKFILLIVILFSSFTNHSQITTILDEKFSAATDNSGLIFSSDLSLWDINFNYGGNAFSPSYCATTTGASQFTGKHLYIKINVVANAKYTLTFRTKRFLSVIVKANETPDQNTLLYNVTIPQIGANNNWVLNTATYTPTYSGVMYFQIINGNVYGEPNTIYIDDIKITQEILCTQPTTQASATGLTVSNATKNSLNVNWKNGNGDKVIVIATPSGTAPIAPASGTAYTANSTYGTGQTTGSNNYVVYNGNGTNVDVTGLNPITTYDFYVYSYNTTGNCYLTTSPYKFSATTLDVCNSPLAPVTYINFPSKTKTSIDVNWTNGSGDKVIIIARKSTDPAVKPTFGASYNANSVFGSGQTTGTGNYVVYNGNGTNVSVTGLTESTNYYFDIYTYNSADNCYKGLITEGSNSKSTSTKSDYYNIKDLTGQTITTCEGKVVDGGGISGTYSSAGIQSITISPENNTDGSCLNFTQWELDNSSEITFYDGATKIYTADAFWKQTVTSVANPAINNIPTFKGPGLVCSSPGNSLKIEFNTNGSGNGFTADITCYSPPKACEINISSVRSGICKGESIELMALGFSGAGILNNDFNGKTLGSDWSTIVNTTFNNECSGAINPGSIAPDNAYFWV